MLAARLLCLAAALSLPLSARPALAEGEAQGPLPPAAAAAFGAVRPDRPPAEIIRDTHYVVSNEDRPQAFRAAVTGRGGVYVGVGSEQNYVLAGWARPEVMVLMDFDQVISDLHRAYGVFFQAAKDGAGLIELWRPESEERAMALITAAYPEPQRQKGVVRAYRIGRHAIPGRLEKVKRLLGAAAVPSFLDDAAQYAYLAGLWRAGRVFPVRGDLTADQTLRDVAGAAKQAAMPVRVLYLSNAEKYFPYGVEFKKSVLALPFDERSLVLRTGARQIGHYVYIVQDGAGFQAWLRKPGILSVHQLARLREQPAAEGEAAFIRRLPGEPERPAAESPAPPKAAERPTPELRGPDAAPAPPRP